ncbi:MAG: response regulator transcription factor [Pseudomonadota bacterium]
MKGKILIIEDDKDLNNLLQYNLKREGFEVDSFYSGKGAIERVHEFNPDLIVLDIMLPKTSGFKICKQLREKPDTENIPVIMLTAKSEEDDRVKGFELGADDYVTKPFSPIELMLRIKAVLKRTSSYKEEKTKFRIGKLVVDEERTEVKVGAEVIQLTLTEFKLLLFLIKNKEKVFSREDLLTSVWGYSDITETRTVDTHIKRLRQKLFDSGDYIKTMHGLGYKFSV